MPSPLSPSRLQSRRPKASRAERTPFDLRLFFPSNNPRLPVAETEKNQCATTYPFVDPEFDAKLGSRHHPIQAPVSFSPPPPFSLPAFRSHVHSLAWSQPRVRQEIKTKLDLGREERHDRHHEARAGLAGAAEKRGEEAEVRVVACDEYRRPGWMERRGSKEKKKKKKKKKFGRYPALTSCSAPRCCPRSFRCRWLGADERHVQLAGLCCRCWSCGAAGWGFGTMAG